ncbi:DUF805 domain-containing protein [Aquirufa sp. HETE-83D]|uniref:DUF805 domain-containing protein n=1 Tax=Aquirufa esocilacus TaxID=3096513 RepID=A0ABW6DJI2_9BACT
MNYYLSILKNYATFTGRARRSEFWYGILFNFLALIVANVLDNVLGTKIMTDFGFELPYGYVYIGYVLLTFIPFLAVQVRRLHDVGKSGWFYLIVLIPLIGFIWLLVLDCTEGTPGPNQYGENPKNVG